MTETRELSFELERFEWVGDDRLEVSGRWQGLTGRKLSRPVLTVEADGRRRRLTALPGGQMPGKGGEAWRATFAWPHGPADVDSAELAIGRNVVVELPAPRRRKRRREAVADDTLRAELAELRAQIAELRQARAGSAEAATAAASAEALAGSAKSADKSPEQARELERAEGELAELRDDHERAEGELQEQLAELREALRRAEAERDGLRAELEKADADRASLREELANLRSEHEALDDQHAALVARSGDLRGQLAEALDAQEPLSEELRVLREAKVAAEADRERLEGELEAVREELAQRMRELAGHREESEQRLGAERAATSDVREKLASAREEAQKALAAEAEETERIRTELATAREEAERLLATERAEVARLREELAARPAAAAEDETEPDDAQRRMYERISRELDHERARVRELRQELDARSAETAEHRRHAAAAATNGVHTTTEERPVAMTPAGRAGRRAAAVLASRAEADARAPYRRAEAARAAAAQRVPEHEQSAVSVWIARAAAFALVALLLVALVIIVSSIA
jgi:chromosome segregation ATPase